MVNEAKPPCAPPAPPSTLVQQFVLDRNDQTLTSIATDGNTTTGREDLTPQHKRALPNEGDIVGNQYRLVRQIGEGMFGRVYLAERTDVPEHRVALKVMTRVVYAGRNMERELVMLAAAGHPHIVQLKDHGVTDEYVWLTMSLYEGETLAERLVRGPLGLREAYEIFLPVARGIQALHERGLRHQDIKPENIFLARFSGRLHPVLLDLGVAVECNASFVAGTVLYCSPEQVIALGGVPGAATLSEKMDTYCLATTLLRALVGAEPFETEASTPYQLANVFEQREREPLGEGVLEELTGEPREQLADALRSWLRHDASERPSAGEMAEQLDVLLEQEREAAREIERGFAKQKASLQRVRVALGAMAMLGAATLWYGFSKRETLRLVGELERVRAEGAASFDKLDTCAAAHELSQRRARRCGKERTAETGKLKRQLEIVVAAGNQAHAAVSKRLEGSRGKLRSCEEEAKKSAVAWTKEKTELQSNFSAQQLAWTGQRRKLESERDVAKKELIAATAKATSLTSQIGSLTSQVGALTSQVGSLTSQVGSLTSGQNECRQDLATCIQDRDTCLAATPKSPPKLVKTKPDKPSAPSVNTATPNAPPPPAPKERPAPKAGTAPEPPKVPAAANQ